MQSHLLPPRAALIILGGQSTPCLAALQAEEGEVELGCAVLLNPTEAAEVLQESRRRGMHPLREEQEGLRTLEILLEMVRGRNRGGLGEGHLR